jgi:transcriptional regulator with XRE-family HTH domain
VNAKLKDAIENRYPSHAQFARELGVPKTTLGDWIRGARPSLEQRRKISARLDVPMFKLGWTK